MKKEFETTMNVVCAWCGADMGTKDGQGVTGTTSGICKTCAKKLWAEAPKTPARWNLVGRFLERRRERRAFLARLEEEHAKLLEFDRQANEREELRQAFEGNPTLQLWAVLHGRPGVHYVDLSVVAVLQERAKDDPEMKARLN